MDAHDQIDQVYFPQSGMVSLLVATGGGGVVETSSIGREGAVGLQCGFGPRLSFTRALVQIPGSFSTRPRGSSEWSVPRPCCAT